MTRSKPQIVIDKYSLAVTITHIAIYTTAFLVTSIYCATITKRQAKDNKWYTPIKKWYRLLSKKRSVYIAAIPHILGMIYL